MALGETVQELLRATVTVTGAEEIRAEIDRRKATLPARRSVWVTDLLDPRTAFFQRATPVPLDADRRRRMEQGRELHVTVGAALSHARHLEVRVQREGIVGQIDLFESRPTELKTTSALPEPDDLVRTRPQYVEQLAMYCALAGHAGGRLLLVRGEEGEALDTAVYDLEFTNLDGIFLEMLRRADLLRAALEHQSSDGLPACDWRGRGCPFEADACDCTGAERRSDRNLVGFLNSCEPRPAEAEALRGALVENTAPPPVVRRFRDLIYPRRAFFERTRGAVVEEEGEAAAPFVPGELYREISDLLEAGATGEVTRETPADGRPMEPVARFRGTPYLLKVSRAWRPAPPSELLHRQPQYFLDLGLRCAALGREEGYLLLGYERAERWPERLAAYRVRFTPIGRYSRFAEQRAQLLEAAVRRADPAALPACPGWMFDGCDYREVCGCEGSSERR